MASRKIVLHDWKPRLRMKPGKVSVFIGRRGAGKSHLMKQVCRAYRHYNTVVFSETEGGNSAWEAHVPPTYIYKLYKPERMQKLYERQCREKRRAKRDPHYVPQSIVVILEDQMFATSLGRDQMLRQVLMNGRHYGITLLITMQYTKGLPPDMREQVDYVFCLQQKNAVMRKRLYDDWFGVFPDFPTFESTFLQCTDNYGCLVMDQTARTAKIQDNVFYYRAPAVIEPYKMGTPAYWMYHYLHYRGEADPDEDEDETEKLEEDIAGRRRRSRVKVVKKRGGGR